MISLYIFMVSFIIICNGCLKCVIVWWGLCKWPGISSKRTIVTFDASDAQRHSPYGQTTPSSSKLAAPTTTTTRHSGAHSAAPGVTVPCCPAALESFQEGWQRCFQGEAQPGQLLELWPSAIRHHSLILEPAECEIRGSAAFVFIAPAPSWLEFSQEMLWQVGWEWCHLCYSWPMPLLQTQVLHSCSSLCLWILLVSNACAKKTPLYLFHCVGVCLFFFQVLWLRKSCHQGFRSLWRKTHASFIV